MVDTVTNGNDANKMVAMVLGGVLVLVGILGWVPGIVNGNGALLGIFGVNTLHNIVHLLTGAVLLAAAFIDNGRNARTINLVLGIVYLVVAVGNLLQPVNDLVNANGNDGTLSPYTDLGLHALLGIVLVGVAMMNRHDTTRPMTGSRM